MRILVVEDEQDLNRILAKTLTAEGYSVDACFDGVEALDYLEGAEYDAIVLDVMMPRMDGFSLLAQMRESGNETPVIFLTAKDSVPDRVRGLDAGADDYLVKPFSFDELLARLRVVMRKRGGSATNVFTVADLTVDTASHHVTRGGRTIALSAKEFALLEYMIRNRGVVLSRERIENHLWNYDYSGGSNVVDVYMSYLRRKIDADYPTKLIHTVWGRRLGPAGGNMKRPSLKLRITGWFALMMFVIEALVLAFLLAVNGTVATNDPEARLVRMVEHNANRVKYNNRQFRFSRIHYNRSGVYTVLYDADGNVLQGTFPAEFTPAEPLPLGSETVRLVDCGDNEYYVYDVRVDMMVGSVWLRGVIDADANGGVMRVILPLAWSLLPVLLVLSVIGGYFIASRALRPVRQLTATANAISDGQDLKARIGLPHTSGSDEIYQLSASFDNMFDRLERSFEAEQRFTSDASHELRTPTTVILAACEDARKNAQTPADYQAALDVIDRQAHKMSALIRSMLEITRLDQGTQKVNWEYADLSDLVTVICDEQAMVARRGIRISCAAEPGIFIDMDVFLISRVVQNLLDNAFKFGVDGGWIHVALRRTAAGAELTVQDNGIGISQENLDKIWQRFYQADPSRQENAGLGLGLSMVQQIVTLHGGTVAVTSAPGHGTTFTVTLPEHHGKEES